MTNDTSSKYNSSVIVGIEPGQSTVTVQLIQLICILGHVHQVEVKVPCHNETKDGYFQVTALWDQELIIPGYNHKIARGGVAQHRITIDCQNKSTDRTCLRPRDFELKHSNMCGPKTHGRFYRDTTSESCLSLEWTLLFYDCRMWIFMSEEPPDLEPFR